MVVLPSFAVIGQLAGYILCNFCLKQTVDATGFIGIRAVVVCCIVRLGFLLAMGSIETNEMTMVMMRQNKKGQQYHAGKIQG